MKVPNHFNKILRIQTLKAKTSFLFALVKERIPVKMSIQVTNGGLHIIFWKSQKNLLCSSCLLNKADARVGELPWMRLCLYAS